MTRAALEHHLRRAWTRRGPLAMLLWPLSRLYGTLGARQRRQGAAAAERLPVPVVVVGNVIVGGAGKTPTTLALAQHLAAAGWRPGIVSRGHGRHGDGCLEVLPGSDPHAVGDEPLLLRRRAQCPVFVGRWRGQAGRALLAAHPDCDLLLCDDGLQHTVLARDVEIGVFDARGTGNGWLLPAGPLREPWPRPLDVLLWTEPPAPAVRERLEAAWRRAPAPPAFVATRALAAQALRSDGGQVPLASLRGRPLTALAGIARPESFFAMLRAAGLQLAHTEALPDHYSFDSLPRSVHAGQTLICTEKDAAKLWRAAPQALAVPLQLELPPAFFGAVDSALAARGYHPRHHLAPAP